MRIRNKKGWIRIVEAFIAILLITGISIMVTNQNSIQSEDISSRINNDQVSILRDIQLNDSLRTEILGTSGTVTWTGFPSKTKNKIENKTPNYLECNAQICDTSDPCSFTSEEEEIYVESVIITSNLTMFNPKLLKLFCWRSG